MRRIPTWGKGAIALVGCVASYQLCGLPATERAEASEQAWVKSTVIPGKPMQRVYEEMTTRGYEVSVEKDGQTLAVRRRFAESLSLRYGAMNLNSIVFFKCDKAGRVVNYTHEIRMDAL